MSNITTRETTREATLEDVSALLKLEQGIIDSERPYDQFIREENVSYYDIPKLISEPESQMIVMESDGQIIGSGYAQIRQSKSCHTHDNHCYLGFIYLDAEYRGRALGHKIIEALKAWGTSRGISHFQLDVFSGNKAAVRAYEKAGFKKGLVRMELEV